MAAWRKLNIPKFLQLSAECKEANHHLEEDDSVINKALLFSDVQRNILDTQGESYYTSYI
jgi:hypothetical protein